MSTQPTPDKIQLYMQFLYSRIYLKSSATMLIVKLSNRTTFFVLRLLEEKIMLAFTQQLIQENENVLG